MVGIADALSNDAGNHAPSQGAERNAAAGALDAAYGAGHKGYDRMAAGLDAVSRV